MMKRNLILVVTLALLLGACAAVTPGTNGLVTEVNGSSISVSVAGQPTTYTLTNRSRIYATDGLETRRSSLTKGQRVMVWAEGTTVERINIQG